MEIPLDVHRIKQKQLIKPEERVLERSSVRILFDYPLGTVGPTAEEKEYQGWIFEFEAPNSKKFFTRGDLVSIIRCKYQEIYDEELKTSTVKESTIPGMLNRAPTSGKFKIWGHSITDLFLEELMYDSKANLLTLGIGS